MRRNSLIAILCLSIAFPTLGGAAEAQSAICRSPHNSSVTELGTGMSSVVLYLDGTGTFHQGVRITRTLPCRPDPDEPHRAWICTEEGDPVHPDGRLEVSVVKSFEYYLVLAHRYSSHYKNRIVVESFVCR